MFAWLDRETRETHNFDPQQLVVFGKQLAQSLADFVEIETRSKTEKVKRAIQLSQKEGSSKKRLIQDIIGAENYEDFKDDIEAEMIKQPSKVAAVKKKKFLKSESPADSMAQQQGTEAGALILPDYGESGFDLHPMCGFEWLMSKRYDPKIHKTKIRKDSTEDSQA